MLSNLVTLRAWVEAGRGGPIFDRYDKIAWFIRLHHQELLDSGSFIPGTGARATLIAPEFDRVVEKIVRREAHRVSAS